MLNYIDKASDSASKQLDKANKTTSRKKEVKARLKMDSRERGIEMAKDKIMKRVKEEYDLVYEHFIGEGFSEEETYERMSNLTEEQLDEFMKALATRAAQYGANLGREKKIDFTGGIQRKPFEAKRKPFDPKPKPGEQGFKAKSPTDVVMSAAVMNRKKQTVSNQTEQIDTYDIVLDHFLNEGYEKKDIIKAMSTVNLTEDQLQNLDEALPAIGAALAALPAIAGKLATGAAVAGKTAVAAGTKGLMAAGKGLAAGSKAAMKGVVSAAKPVVKSATAVKDLAGKGVSSAKDIAGKGVSSAKDVASNVGQQIKKVTSQPTGGSGEDRLKRLKDFAKRETGNVVKQKVLQGVEPTGTNKTGLASAKTTDIAASADLFDIVKGQLLDEGLSEEEIRDIMLTLTPDEILNELSGDLLKRAAIKAGDERGKLASQGDREGAVKKLDQQKKFSDAMKSKNLEKSRAENMRKPTQYDRPVSRPQPDPTKPYPGTPR